MVKRKKPTEKRYHTDAQYDTYFGGVREQASSDFQSSITYKDWDSSFKSAGEKWGLPKTNVAGALRSNQYKDWRGREVGENVGDVLEGYEKEIKKTDEPSKLEGLKSEISAKVVDDEDATPSKDDLLEEIDTKLEKIEQAKEELEAKERVEEREENLRVLSRGIPSQIRGRLPAYEEIASREIEGALIDQIEEATTRGDLDRLEGIVEEVSPTGRARRSLLGDISRREEELFPEEEEQPSEE